MIDLSHKVFGWVVINVVLFLACLVCHRVLTSTSVCFLNVVNLITKYSVLVLLTTFNNLSSWLSVSLYACSSIFMSVCRLFLAISNAYSVLSDPDKRQKYDMYGEEGLRPSTNHTHYYTEFDQFKLFRQMFSDDLFGESE